MGVEQPLMNIGSMRGVDLQLASCASAHSKAPVAKRPRDSKVSASDGGKVTCKKQRRGSSSLAQIPGLNGGAESSLLLCLHALTHCTDQLKRQVAASPEDVQLLSDIATAAGRLQRVARQQLQLLQTPATGAAVQEPMLQQRTSQHDLQHDMQAQVVQDVVMQLDVSQPPAAFHNKQQQQQQVASHRNTAEQPATRTVTRLPKQQNLQQQQHFQLVTAQLEPQRSQDLPWGQHQHQQTQSQARVRLPPAPTANKLSLSRPLQHAAAAAWQVDKQPYTLHQDQHAAAAGAGAGRAKTHAPSIHSNSSPSRAAAALGAALAAAAAEADTTFAAIACSSGDMPDDDDLCHQQQQQQRLFRKPPGAVAALGPPTVHLPALKRVDHVQRDRLKNLAVAVEGNPCAAGDVAAVAGRVPEAPGSQARGAADPNRIKGRSAAAAAAVEARKATYISSESAGHCSSSSDSSGRSGSSSSSDNSGADSGADLPLTQSHNTHTNGIQKHKKQQQPRDKPASLAAAGAQQCLVCRQVFPADRLVSSKLFCSCQSCLTAAVQCGSRRGYRLAQCPKRGCDAMLIKLGKSGWHTGSSGPAHCVEVDSKTGLFRIGYSKKSSKSRKSLKKGVSKGRPSVKCSAADG